MERESESSGWRELGIVTTARAKRMRDVQFLSELLIILLKGKVSGFDQNEITEYYAVYDDLTDLDVLFDEEHLKYIERAMDIGVDAVEIDVHLSKDKLTILFTLSEKWEAYTPRLRVMNYELFFY